MSDRYLWDPLALGGAPRTVEVLSMGKVFARVRTDAGLATARVDELTPIKPVSAVQRQPQAVTPSPVPQCRRGLIDLRNAVSTMELAGMGRRST